MAILIAKADGTQELFNPEKLIFSLMRAGAEHAAARAIAEHIERELYNGITTQEIYRHAFARLRDARALVAARYSLKRSLLQFGPSGFPFEAYLAELFALEGYKTKTDQIVQGACVPHEVDVVLSKNRGRETVYVEAKFHNAAGFKTDLKTVLYVKARLDDIAAHRTETAAKGAMRGLIITNTKFTSLAARYASCAGVELLGWEEPRDNSLQQRIEVQRLYPVTALTTLNHREKMALLSRKVVLCSSLVKDTRALGAAGLTGARADRVLSEAETLCGRKERLE